LKHTLKRLRLDFATVLMCGEHVEEDEVSQLICLTWILQFLCKYELRMYDTQKTIHDQCSFCLLV